MVKRWKASRASQAVPVENSPILPPAPAPSRYGLELTLPKALPATPVAEVSKALPATPTKSVYSSMGLERSLSLPSICSSQTSPPRSTVLTPAEEITPILIGPSAPLKAAVLPPAEELTSILIRSGSVRSEAKVSFDVEERLTRGRGSSISHRDRSPAPPRRTEEPEETTEDTDGGPPRIPELDFRASRLASTPERHEVFAIPAGAPARSTPIRTTSIVVIPGSGEEVPYISQHRLPPMRYEMWGAAVIARRVAVGDPCVGRVVNSSPGGSTEFLVDE